MMQVEYTPIPSFFDPVPVPPYIPDKVPRAKKEPGTEEKKKRGRPRTTVKKEAPETPQQGTTPVEESMDEDVNMSKVFEDEAEDAFDDDSEENSFVNEEMEEEMNQQEVKPQQVVEVPEVKEVKPVVEEEPKPKRKSTKKNVTLDQLFNTVPALTTTTTEEPPKTEKKKRTYTRRTKATTTEDEEEKPKTRKPRGRKAATTPTEPATTAPPATEPPAATPAKDEIIVLDDEGMFDPALSSDQMT